MGMEMAPQTDKIVEVEKSKEKVEMESKPKV